MRVCVCVCVHVLRVCACVVCMLCVYVHTRACVRMLCGKFLGIKENFLGLFLFQEMV